MDFLEELKQALQTRFPGAEARLELIDYGDGPDTIRVGGELIWGGFQGMTHIQRQRELRLHKEAALTEEQRMRLSAILTFTPAEIGELMAA